MTDKTDSKEREALRKIGEEQAFEAWFKVDCPVEGANAKIAAKAAWKARASLAASAGSEPVARVNDDGFIVEIGDLPIAPGQKLYLHPSPPERMVMVPLDLAIDSPIRDVLITWMEKGIKGECFLYKDMWAAVIAAAAPPTSSADSRKGE